MRNILSFLKKYRLMVLCVILLLVAQSFCELALPTYTKDILNIGLQQNGIPDAAAQTVRAETLEKLVRFMSAGEAAAVESAYLPADESGLRVLSEETERASVSAAMLMPECLLYELEHYDLSALSLSASADELIAAPAEHSEDISRLALSIEEKTESYKNQLAVEFVYEEYTLSGLDTDSLRSGYLWGVGGKMLLMSLLAMAISAMTGFLSAKISSGMGRDLRERVFTKVMSFSETEMDHFTTASLITRSTNDIAQIQTVSVMLLSFVIYAPILALGGIVMAINTGAGMGIIIVDCVLLLVDAVLYLSIIVMPKFRIMQKLVDKVNLIAREILTGIIPIRAFSRQKHEEERFDEASRDLMKTHLFTGRVMAFLSPVMMFIMNGASVLIVWLGARKVNAGVIQIGDITAYITYTSVIVAGFLMLAMVSLILPRAAVAADRINEVLEMKVYLTDPAEAMDGQLDGARGELRFENVSFRYPGAEANSLEDISFTAKPGQTTAIIGSTGCGKTTLVNLIPRFYDPTAGSITLDGVDIRTVTQNKLRSLIGYVPQKGVLFSGTVASNLRYAEGVTDESMIAAVETAQAGFIEELEGGYDYAVSQGGTNVSGGQRQRLSIARALAGKPKILIFDDSFSALDYKTDLALRKALKASTAEATVIIVAQRISTVLHADNIIVLENGRTVGMGTHEELLSSCRAYQEIASSQLSEKELGMKGGEA